MRIRVRRAILLATPSLLLSSLAVLVALLETASARGFNPTAMVYVAMARALGQGQGISTDILFTASPPSLPSPMSVWGPLYPVTITGLSAVGFEMPIAARLSAALAFGLSVLLAWWLGSLLFNTRVGIVSALTISIWPALIRTATTAGSESLFVMLVVASTAATVHSIRCTNAAPGLAWSTVGGLLMGLACLARYAGAPLIPVGAAALLLARRRSPRQRLSRTLLWATAGALPLLAWLVRNLLVTGSLIGAGRQRDDLGLIYHLASAARTVAHDVLELVARFLIVPEFWGTRALLLPAVLLVAGSGLLLVFVRRRPTDAGLIQAVRVAVGKEETRFVLAIGLGYWGAMVLARSIIGFYPLDSRLMMPAYPLLAVVTWGAAARFLEGRWPTTAHRLPLVVGASSLAVILILILPRSLRAGGPHLSPPPPPPWVEWVRNHTPDGAIIVGNLSFDYNFYLRRPVVEFSGNRYGISRFDCRRISQLLQRLPAGLPAYLVLRPERGRFDPELMGRLHGPLVKALVEGENTPLPLREVVRERFVAYEILDTRWNCP